jgi:hypothetical protein
VEDVQMRPEGATMTFKVRPLGTSVTTYVPTVVAFPSCPKIALDPESRVRLILSGSRMLFEAFTNPATVIRVPVQLVVLNCIVLVVWRTQTGPFVLIASWRPSLRYAVTVCAPARTRALRR